jgi:transcriptional regulator with XRE-family HTH domain
MPTRDRCLTRARATSRRLVAGATSDIKNARIAAGISQKDLGRAAGMSASQVGRFERGQIHFVTVDKICRLSAAVGLEASLRLYPDGDPIRDAAQVRLLERLRVRLSSNVRWRTEVPLFAGNDPRAWDAVADGTGCVDGIEAETRLGDIQATERRIMLKHRDDASVRHVFMLVADTRANRAALALGRETLRGNFPLDTREAIASLANGRCPGANGVVII